MLGKTVIDPGWHFVDASGQRVDPALYPVSRVLTTRRPLKETDFGVIAPPRDHITWVSVTAFPEFGDAGQIERVVVSFHDISERRRAQADFERARQFALSVLDGLNASVCVLDMHGTILAVNRFWKAFHIANGGSADVVHEGMNYLQVAGAATTSSDRPEGGASFKTLLEQVLAGQRDHFEREYLCHSPTTQRWFMARVSCMKGVHPLRVVVAHDDVTELKLAQERTREAVLFSHNLIDSMQDGFAVLDEHGQPAAFLATVKDHTRIKRMEDEIKRLAFHDALTDLPNRRLLEDRLERAQAVATRSDQHSAVVLIDLDGFKEINDEHGHEAGDRLLVEVGRRLKACVREVDTAARLGGDEFAVVFGELSGDVAEVIEKARTVAEKIREALAQPYRLAGDHAPDPALSAVTCTASIGVGMFAGTGLRAVDALRAADVAMYEAKRSGGNQVKVA